MEAFDAPAEQIDEAVAAERDAGLFDVYADNAESVLAFIAMTTQWRVASGMTFVRLGLEYASIPIVLDGMGIRDRARRREIFEDLRVMESAALKVYAEEAQQQAMTLAANRA